MFFSVAIAHLLAVMSPGPDTAIIFQQSLNHGRFAGVYTAAGIGLGLFMHCLLAISGISLLIYNTDEARFFIKCLGASYLIFLGITYFIGNNSNPINKNIIFNNPFIIGFVTNILNVKAFMFIVSLFTFIDLQPNSFMSLIYLFYFPLITFIWFAFVSFALTHETLGVRFNKYTNKIQIASSLFIIILGVIILIETIYEIF